MADAPPLAPDADARAAAARHRLEALVQNSPACLASLAGPDHMVTVTNQLFRELFGGRPLAGLPLREALPELASEPFFALLDAVHRTGNTCYGREALTYHAASPAAGHRPVHFTFIAQAVRDAAGAVSGLLLFAYNVSAYVRARQQGANSQAPPASTRQQLALANEQLAVANEELDVTNEELTVSNQELGTTNRELALANEHLSVANQQLRASNEAIGTQAAELRRAELALRRLSEELALTNEGLVETVANSVLEADSARREAVAQRHRLHQLLTEAPALIAVLTGPDHRVDLVNDGLRHLLGGRELVGKPYREALPESAGHPFFQTLNEVYRTGHTYYGTDEPAVWDRLSAGQLHTGYFNYICQATRDAAGHIDGILFFAYDMTAQVLARHVLTASQQQVLALNQQLTASNEALGTTNQQLTHTNQELDTFVYTASHDLQGPIINLDGLLDALREELPADVLAGPAAPILGRMQDSVERFYRTLGHLAAIGRLHPASGEAGPPVDLAPVVREVLLDLALPLAAASAHVDVDVADCPPVAFLASNLRSVVYNLLSNAVKYRHPDRVPHVQVRARAGPHHLRLDVQDNGLGLSDEQQAQLFGLFRRLHDHVEGSGVGLYMVKKMVENSGGRIAVQSQLGTGSTFTVYFNR